MPLESGASGLVTKGLFGTSGYTDVALAAYKLRFICDGANVGEIDLRDYLPLRFDDDDRPFTLEVAADMSALAEKAD